MTIVQEITFALLAAVGAVAGSELMRAGVAVPSAPSLMRYAETAVAMLLFTCPNTNRKAPTGVEMDVQGLRAQWKARLKLDCPYCSDVHDICVREVYVNGALDNLERPRRA